MSTPRRATNITRQYDEGRMQPVDAPAITWDELLDQLGGGGTFWLTVTLDGAPHTRPVFGVVADGRVHVCSSTTAAKTRALHAGNPTSIALGSPGLDVVWSGVPRRVTDVDQLATVAEAYRSTYGWEVSVDGARSALTAPYGAPTAGPPPYEAFRIEPHSVHAIGTDALFAGRSTRWDFD